MRSRYLFLLVYLLGSCFAASHAQRNETCTTRETCGRVPDSTSHFLQCVGLPREDSGRDHLRRLKDMLEATMDVYTFMRSSMTEVPFLSLQGALELKPDADPLQNEALVEMWLDVRIKPLLKSITKNFLSCLSTKNFSCSTYQTVVRELSLHYSDMNPVRQKWIYTFFMYPFLSGDRVAGCATQGENSEDWLMKNFGAFRAMARMKDLSALNMVFSGLEVLHLLSPAQKAELLLMPEVSSLDNGTLTLVFNSLLTGGSGPHPTARPGHNWTSPGYPVTYPPRPTHGSLSPQNTLREVANGFTMAFRPIGSFVHDFVSFVHERNVSQIRSTTLTQFLLNWTLAELADIYRPQNTSVVPETPKFDVTNVEDWYQQVVVPTLRRFFPNDEAVMHQNIRLAFHQVFYLDHGKNNESSEIRDVCSITLDKSECGMTNVVENVARVLHCAARTNLTMSETMIMRLIEELTERLNSLMAELAKADLKKLASDFQQIFTEADSTSLTQGHLEDPNFIKLWFKTKLMPVLPDVPPALLSCLSTKNFSCPVFQTIVAALSKHMSFMNAHPMYSHNIYEHFIYSFLLHHNTSDPHCLSANHSAEWLKHNFGFFSRFAVVTDFYSLNPNFSGLEVLHLMSSKQKADMLLLPLPTPPGKDVVINRVFDFLLESPEKLPEVLHHLVQLARKVNPPCGVYRHIFERLYGAIPSLPPDIEPVTWASIDELTAIAPDACVPENITCPVTNVNAANICKGTNSSDLQSYLKTLSSMDVPCNFTLEKYACAKLENFTANQLVSLLKCNLPGNSSHSKVLWKMLLTKLSFVLDEALDILANMSMTMVGPSASEVLDVIGEIRVLMLTDEQLMNSSVIRKWFSGRLSRFLPHASGSFLRCLSHRNLSCHSYQKILQVFIHRFDAMTLKQQHVVLREFILHFLSQPHSGPGCVNGSRDSAEWLKENLGPFSALLSLRELLHLNPHFHPLEVLRVLTPKQSAELLELNLPTLPHKDVIINKLFDHLTEPLEQKKLPQFLFYLVMFLQKEKLSCSSYKTLFTRLDLAMAQVSPNIVSNITYSKMALSRHIPPGCIIYTGKCNVTMTNETDICVGVNSTALQLHLDSGKMHGRFCDFAIEEFACASLSALTAEGLAAMLMCHHSSNSSGSRAVWKLLLSKASHVLDEALDLLTNKTLDPSDPALPLVLDAIREIRLDALSSASLNNPAVIQLWFNRRLRSFLPAVSPDFLSCLTTLGLNCSSYQHILQVFIHQFDAMTLKQQHVVLKEFILHFLSQPHSGPGCVNGSRDSAEWLKENLGPFSALLSLRELLRLNPHFHPLEVLRVLTPKQSAELLELNLPTLPHKDVIINKLFDHLTEPLEQKKLPQFLFYLVMFLQKEKLSCSSYKTLFTRLDLAMAQVSLNIASNITYSKMALSRHIPPGCIIYNEKCNVTMTNETDICVGVNSTALQLHLDSGKMHGRFCDFAAEEFACASLSALTAEGLAAMLMCHHSSNSSGSRAVWKLLLSKASHVLDEALDLLTNKTLDPSDPALPLVLDAIREIRLDALSSASLNNPAVIQLWFNRRLRPFLPAVSPDFLSCLTTLGLNCSSYQHIVQILSRLQPHMTLARQMFVYTHFIKVFLTKNNTADLSCSLHINNSGEWLQKNLGAFSVLVSFHDLQMLYSKFSVMEALPEMTVRQLAEVSATLGLLTSPAQVQMVMKHVPSQQLPAFFDDFSPAIMGHENMYLPAVRSAMLQVVFDRANLSDHSVTDSVVLLWLHNRLRPLLVNLSPLHVAPFFKILSGRNCSIEQQGVGDLNSTISSLTDDAKKEIHNHIIQSLRGPVPLHCYGDNYNHSFYSFLERSFMGFQFPKLTTFLSLMPHDKMQQLVNSMPPSAFGDFLRRPDIIDSDKQLCVLYDNYIKTPMFLETESVPAAVRRPTLPCVWPMALSSSKKSEVDTWFNQRLHNYLGFLTKSLLSPSITYNATCLAFQKLVSVLGEYNYTAADFVRRDVFSTIRAYLTSAAAPRCYSPSNPELNSTAWFAEYIGPFMPFLTLEDLQAFGSEEVIQVFTVNPANIALLNHSTLPVNLTDFYTQLVYEQDSNFNPLLLPLLCRCVAPGPAFTQLTSEQSITVLHNLTTLCSNLDPQVAAALAGNLGEDIDATAITALGNESTGMSTGQIKTIKPQDLLDALGTLSSVMGWNEGQARAIIQSLMSSGVLEINSMSSLFMLGSLVVGVPTTVFGGIGGSELITASQNPSFLTYLISAPVIIQQTYVTQIISVNSESNTIIENVPDEMATEIPRSLLLGFSSSETVITKLNRKKWKQQQVELFFDVIAVEGATAELGGADNLTSSVLQGFTCTTVRTIKKVQIKKLIKACRRKGTKKVTLVETQLTCMYNYIKGDSDATDFSLYPYDMLLYYDYSLVPQASCRSYFEQVADADFYVFSSALRYKLTNLFANARSCLGVTNTSLTKDNILVLGNMCCTLDGSYIENSDPFILEKLKNCRHLTKAQGSAVQSLLLSGKTQYGAPSTWKRQTLEDLGMLPLYLTSTFYDNFDKKTKRKFLKYFLRVLRRNRVAQWKKRRLRQEIRKSVKKKSKRSIVNECTVGTITQVTISDETFPFDYDDVAQFNCCLSAATVQDNLDAITNKVDEEEYLRIVLSKLHEAYAANSTIPEDQVQVLGPASRVATIDDINKWSITKIDTLSALMDDDEDGEWDPSLAKAIISKYLSQAGNKLGSTELNTIGGVNLCSLDVDVLKSISKESLKEADALDVSNCTTEKKRELFNIALQAFARSTQSSVSVSRYQLTKPYLGGTTSSFLRSLTTSNINMDMATFTSLNEDAVLSLTVNEVKGLLGTNLPELKAYENETLIQNWISRQFQSDLDTLGLGLVGGKANVTSSPSSFTSTTSATTSTTTTGNGNHIRADTGLSLLVLLTLFVTSWHIVV